MRAMKAAGLNVGGAHQTSKVMLDWLPMLVMLACVVGVDLLVAWRTAAKDSEAASGVFWRFEGDRRVRSLLLLGLIVAWWVLPGGWLLVGAGCFLLSWLSPAGRAAWTDERLPRWGMVASVLLGFLLVGFLPPPAPTTVASFGEPIEAMEDQGLPWPHLVERHHLLTGDRDGVDVAVVTVSSMRIPWQGADAGMSGGVLVLGDMINMAEREMRDAVLLLTESAPLPVPVDGDTLGLKPVAGEASTNAYRLDGELTKLAFRRWDVTSDLTTSGDGVKIGEVVLIAAPASSAGCLELLTVVRPVGHPALASDPMAEAEVEAWWAAKVAKV